ncbi:MAG TPA: anti-sigma factor [Candidatus Binataceae bacterium]|nr:anti-sigma factor [Candidatus Binataceae bacterium]
MDQTHPDKTALAASSGPDAEISESRRSGLWRALAGMAVALAIAAGIVTIDLSHELIERMAHYRSRIASLNRRMNTLKQKAQMDEQRLADAREEIKERKLMESKDRIKAILIAPDRRTFKLVAPASGEGASATVTISAKMGGAVLNARGLPAPPEGQVYDAWWMLKDAPPAKAAEFRSAVDGSANEYLDPPPQGPAPASLSITMEPSEGGIAPTGAVKLQGKVPAGAAEERSGGAKKH